MGKESMALEIDVQYLSICRSKDSSVMLISILHIASNVSCESDIGRRLTIGLLHAIQIFLARLPLITLKKKTTNKHIHTTNFIYLFFPIHTTNSSERIVFLPSY